MMQPFQKQYEFFSRIDHCQTHILRLPAAFGIQKKPYDPVNYSEEAELQELGEKKRLTRSEALIRWRWKKDADGNIVFFVFEWITCRFVMLEENQFVNLIHVL